MARACCWIHSQASRCQQKERQKCEGGAAHIWAVWQTKMWLTSCLSWVWRCTVSAFHCREEWTSSDGTWEDMQSGPVGSECWQSGRTTVCRKQASFVFLISHVDCFGALKIQMPYELECLVKNNPNQIGSHKNACLWSNLPGKAHKQNKSFLNKTPSKTKS